MVLLLWHATPLTFYFVHYVLLLLSLYLLLLQFCCALHILADTAGSPVEREGSLFAFCCYYCYCFFVCFLHCYALLLFLSVITAVTVMWSVAHISLTFRCIYVCVWLCVQVQLLLVELLVWNFASGKLNLRCKHMLACNNNKTIANARSPHFATFTISTSVCVWLHSLSLIEYLC